VVRCGRLEKTPFVTARTRVASLRRSNGSEQAERLVLCLAKRTGKRPMCDGSIRTRMPRPSAGVFSEEIPARMQARAAEICASSSPTAWWTAGLVYEGAKPSSRASPCARGGGRSRQAARLRRRRRAPVSARRKNAIQGFLKAAGLASIDEPGLRRTRRAISMWR